MTTATTIRYIVVNPHSADDNVFVRQTGTIHRSLKAAVKSCAKLNGKGLVGTPRWEVRHEDGTKLTESENWQAWDFAYA